MQTKHWLRLMWKHLRIKNYTLYIHGPNGSCNWIIKPCAHVRHFQLRQQFRRLECSTMKMRQQVLWRIQQGPVNDVWPKNQLPGKRTECPLKRGFVSKGKANVLSTFLFFRGHVRILGESRTLWKTTTSWVDSSASMRLPIIPGW